MNGACEVIAAWNFAQWMGASFASLLFLYIGSRLVSAAYFRSKLDHEQRKG